MTYFIAGNTAVENARALSQSALPNAPQEPHEARAPRRAQSARARLSAVLRITAERELRLADRLDPTCPTIG
jgi:membrane carboxypeptidase/penicillin-binding protein PbpC